MSVDICHDAWKRVATLYDNTTDTAFGPIFTGTGAGDDAQDFLDWLADGVPRDATIRPVPGTDGTDARHYLPHQLDDLVIEWRQWAEQNPRPEIEPQSLRVPDDYPEGRVQT